jgi:CheY-like chemotaxis protein
MLLALESMGHDGTAAQNGTLAIEELKADKYDVVFLDLKLSQESGLDVPQEILRVSPRTAVIMFTAFASIDTAVEAMRRDGSPFWRKRNGKKPVGQGAPPAQPAPRRGVCHRQLPQPFPRAARERAFRACQGGLYRSAFRRGNSARICITA